MQATVIEDLELLVLIALGDKCIHDELIVLTEGLDLKRGSQK